MVTEQAATLVDREGIEALSLSAIAGRLSVRPSALYTHLDGVEGLRYLVAVHATRHLADSVAASAIGQAGGSAIHAMGTAYRAFAIDHPGQFASTLHPPRADDDELARANRAILNVFVLVYGAMGYDEEAAHLAARSTRSAIHGFLALEHNAGTTEAHEAEYLHLLRTLERGLELEAVDPA